MIEGHARTILRQTIFKSAGRILQEDFLKLSIYGYIRKIHQ